MMNPFRFSVKFLVGPRDSQEAGHFRFVFYGEIHIRNRWGPRACCQTEHALDLADIFVTCIDDLDSFHVLLENPLAVSLEMGLAPEAVANAKTSKEGLLIHQGRIHRFQASEGHISSKNMAASAG